MIISINKGIVQSFAVGERYDPQPATAALLWQSDYAPKSKPAIILYAFFDRFRNHSFAHRNGEIRAFAQHLLDKIAGLRHYSHRPEGVDHRNGCYAAPSLTSRERIF
jgi:hypothetical protein